MANVCVSFENLEHQSVTGDVEFNSLHGINETNVNGCQATSATTDVSLYCCM